MTAMHCHYYKPRFSITTGHFIPRITLLETIELKIMYCAPSSTFCTKTIGSCEILRVFAQYHYEFIWAYPIPLM